MASRKQGFDWGVWVRSFGVWIVGIIGVLVTFYFTTTATLKEHERQFVEVAKKFDVFNTTQNTNFAEYIKNQKSEAETREKMREQFMALFNQLNTNSATTKVQVEQIGKQLEGAINKIEGISNRQLQPDRRR